MDHQARRQGADWCSPPHDERHHPQPRCSFWFALISFPFLLSYLLFPSFAATVGTIFTATECTLESVRGKKDPFNGALAGCASGAVLGFYGSSFFLSLFLLLFLLAAFSVADAALFFFVSAVGRPSVAVGGCAAMAAMSAFVDIAGGRFGPHDMSDNAAEAGHEEH